MEFNISAGAESWEVGRVLTANEHEDIFLTLSSIKQSCVSHFYYFCKSFNKYCNVQGTRDAKKVLRSNIGSAAG